MRRRLTLAVAGTLVAAAAAARLAAALRRYDFRDKVAFVTGGSRGLGLAIARELSRRGARVAICGRDEASLEAAARDLRDRGAEVLPVACDVRCESQLTMALRRTHERLGPIDVVVHNAGTIAVGPVETMTRADFEDALDTHFWPAQTLLNRVVPSMRERGGGRIVLVSSIGGKISVPHLVPYSVSKFALTALGEGLRAELARFNIGVTTVCPGLMRTGSPRNARFKSRHRAEYTWFALSDTLPLLSISANRAARAIVEACARNQAELILSLPAKIAVAAEGLMPNVTAAVLAFAARLLPDAGGIGSAHASGDQSETPLTRSPLTGLGRRAERDLNQLQQ